MQAELQQLIDYIRTEHHIGKLAGLPPIELTVKNNIRSKAKYWPGRNIRKIIIAQWCIDAGTEKAYATTLHEMCHFIIGHKHNHDKSFRAMEIVLLADFGLKPIRYSRAYYSELQTLNGDTVWRY